MVRNIGQFECSKLDGAKVSPIPIVNAPPGNASFGRFCPSTEGLEYLGELRKHDDGRSFSHRL